jgi:hypothetical protein
MKRSPNFTAAALSLAACACVYAVQSRPPKGVVMFNSGEATWLPGGGPGSVRAPIYGDPSKPGPYLHLIKVPPNSVSGAHTYSDSRTYTVISGTWYVGFGNRYDESKLIALPPGSYYAVPAGVALFNATKDDGAVIQIGGTGPTQHVDIEPGR